MRDDEKTEMYEIGCTLDKALKLLSTEWTAHILWHLSRNGPSRHGALKRLIKGISSKVLTDRLRRLERTGLVYRDYEPTVPPKVTYGLTPTGAKIDKALFAFEEVAEDWADALERQGSEQPRRREPSDDSQRE